ARGMPDWSRRSLLRTGGAIAIGSLVAGFVGRLLLEKQRAPATAIDIPAAPLPANLPAGASIASAELPSAGLTPIVVPNPDFYRIDKAFIVPTVDRDSWSLTVKGL